MPTQNAEMVLEVPSTKINLTVPSGETKTVGLLDMNYLIMVTLEHMEGTTTKQQMEAVAKAFTEQLGYEFSWGEAAFLVEQIRDKLEELKKTS